MPNWMHCCVRTAPQLILVRMSTTSPYDGARVRFQGLSSRAELNGTEGTVLHRSPDGSRWAVRCDVSNEIVAVREQNLGIVLSTNSQLQSFFNGRPPSAMTRTERDLRDNVDKVAAAAAGYDLSTPVGAMAVNALRMARYQLASFLEKKCADAAPLGSRDMSEPTLLYEQVLEAVKELVPIGAVEEEELAICYNNLAVCCRQAEDYSEALRCFGESFKLCPHMAVLRHNMAKCTAHLASRPLVSCNTCGRLATDVPLERCERCQAAGYCSPACRQGDAVAHQPFCVPPVSQPPVVPAPTNSRTATDATKAEEIESERKSAAAAATAVAFAKLSADQQDQLKKRQGMVLPPGIELQTTRPDGAIQGGKARLRGLAGKPELNGSVGRLIGYDDRKARFMFRPDIGGEAMLIKPWNVEAVDSFPEPMCDVDSGAFCEKLASNLAACGMALPVTDLTHLITDFKDMLALHSFIIGCDFGSTASPFAGCCLYLQRTRSNAPFFLFVRETTMACNGHAAAPPFLVVPPGDNNGILVPPGGGKALDEAYMLRFCLSCLCPTFNCPICLDSKPTSGDGKVLDSNGLDVSVPNSFPCGHLICRSCTAQLMPFRVRGVTCPVCREVSPTWIVESDGLGGGKLVECP